MVLGFQMSIWLFLSFMFLLSGFLLGLLVHKIIFSRALVKKLHQEMIDRTGKFKDKIKVLSSEVKALNELVSLQKIQIESNDLVMERKIKEGTGQVEESYAKMKKINKEFDEFTYRVAHDLKGPIKRILGLCNTATYEVKEEVALAYFSMLGKEGEQMEQLLDRLLLSDKVKNKNLEISNIHLKPFVELLLQRLSKSFPQVKFDMVVDDALKMDTDQSLLQLILYNLLENGAVYNYADDSHLPFVQVEINADSQYINISVIDNGEGVSDDHAGKIFFMFFRGSEKSNGSGLGLYVASKAAEKIGALLTLDNKGQTRFTLRIPY